jgi:hypothetical protein
MGTRSLANSQLQCSKHSGESGVSWLSYLFCCRCHCWSLSNTPQLLLSPTRYQSMLSQQNVLHLFIRSSQEKLIVIVNFSKRNHPAIQAPPSRTCLRLVSPPSHQMRQQLALSELPAPRRALHKAQWAKESRRNTDTAAGFERGRAIAAKGLRSRTPARTCDQEFRTSRKWSVGLEWDKLERLGWDSDAHRALGPDPVVRARVLLLLHRSHERIPFCCPSTTSG